MKPIAILILKYAGILLAILVILWWVFYLSPFNIPEFIPYTPIKPHGVVLSTFMIFLLIRAQKEIIKLSPAINIFKLTVAGAVMVFLSEIIFQSILSCTGVEDKLHFIIEGVISTTILFAIFSFFISFQLKTKKTNQLIIFIITFLILFRILSLLFPSILIHK